VKDFTISELLIEICQGDSKKSQLALDRQIR